MRKGVISLAFLDLDITIGHIGMAVVGQYYVKRVNQSCFDMIHDCIDNN